MRTIVCFLVVMSALIACGSQSSSSGSTAASRSVPRAADDATCPLLVPGTSFTVEDTTNGAALVFVTTGDPLAVRARAAALAEMHTKHDGPATAFGMMFTAGSTATATEVEGGARVEFAAAQPDGASAIQKELRMHAKHLAGGSCEM